MSSMGIDSGSGVEGDCDAGMSRMCGGGGSSEIAARRSSGRSAFGSDTIGSHNKVVAEKDYQGFGEGTFIKFQHDRAAASGPRRDREDGISLRRHRQRAIMSWT